MRGTLSAEAIVDSTLAALDEVGADQLSLRLITDRLGVTPPAIYEYFDGKEQILRAAAERIYAELGARMQTAHDGSIDSVIDQTRAYVTYARAHPQRYYLMMRFPPPIADFPTLEVGLAGALDTFEAGMASVRAAIEKGAIRGDEILTPMVIWSVAHGVATLVTTAAFDDATADAVIEHALDVLRAGLSEGERHH